MEKVFLSEAHDRLYNMLPYGKENRISREKLCSLLGKGDRVTRDMIADLREAGYDVCSSSGCGGYWKPSNAEERREYLEEQERRARSTFRNVRGMQRNRKNSEDQLHA